MSAHTPGPWKESEWAVWAGDEMVVDCGIPMLGMSPESAIANARLIAAAPDLLEQLESLKEWVKNWDCQFTQDPEFSWGPIDSAIAKAKGEDH